MEKLETVKAIEINSKKVYIRSLRFRDFARLANIVTRLIQDLGEGDVEKINLITYFEEAIPLMSSMTGMKEEEIENLKADEGLKLLRACVEVILEDTAFLQEMKELLKIVAEKLTKVSQSMK